MADWSALAPVQLEHLSVLLHEGDEVMLDLVIQTGSLDIDKINFDTITIAQLRMLSLPWSVKIKSKKKD